MRRKTCFSMAQATHKPQRQIISLQNKIISLLKTAYIIFQGFHFNEFFLFIMVTQSWYLFFLLTSKQTKELICVQVLLIQILVLFLFFFGGVWFLLYRHTLQTSTFTTLRTLYLQRRELRVLFGFITVFNGRTGGDSLMVCSKISQHQPHVLLCSGAYSTCFYFLEELDSDIARFGS